jgi:hypothetical protein
VVEQTVDTAPFDSLIRDFVRPAGTRWLGWTLLFGLVLAGSMAHIILPLRDAGQLLAVIGALALSVAASAIAAVLVAWPGVAALVRGEDGA